MMLFPLFYPPINKVLVKLKPLNKYKGNSRFFRSRPTLMFLMWLDKV